MVNNFENICVGVDYSMNSPAISIIKKGHNGEIVSINSFCVNGKTEKNINFSVNSVEYHIEIEPYPIVELCDHMKRFDLVSNKMVEFIDRNKHTFLSCSNPIIEGYSYGSTGKAYQIGENAQTFKYKVYHEYGVEFESISPKQIKMFATSNGNASKSEMSLAFNKKFNFDIYEKMCYKVDTSPLNDIIDSIFVALYDENVVSEYKRNKKSKFKNTNKTKKK